jgi:rod shape-determining protein MreC
VTSGLGGIFPGGMFIGTVEESEDKEGELFRKISLRPGVNFNNIEEVFVLISPIE